MIIFQNFASYEASEIENQRFSKLRLKYQTSEIEKFLGGGK